MGPQNFERFLYPLPPSLQCQKEAAPHRSLMSPCLLILRSLLFLFFLLACFHSPAPVISVTAPSDVAALVAFKAAIAPASIDQSSCLASWDFSSDPCRPAQPTHFTCGIYCSDDATRVTALILERDGCSGTLSPSLANLSLLTHLDLSYNSFYGSIPFSLSSLSSLQTLVLSWNSLSGWIPYSLSNLTSLQTLDLSVNNLSGPIPDTLSSLTNLTTMDLSSNSLAGGLPSTLPPNLVELALSQNFLLGPLRRPTFAPLQYLEFADLAVNKFEGKLEGWFLLLPSLQLLRLANNTLQQLEVWEATAEVQGAPLVFLDLGFNLIEGPLPAALAAYPSLEGLSVRHNRMRGQIPWEFYGAKKGVQFKWLFLDGNFLNGSAPEQLLGGGVVLGSLGDNCLQSCPSTAALCSPEQKPDWLCKQIYGGEGRG